MRFLKHGIITFDSVAIYLDRQKVVFVQYIAKNLDPVLHQYFVVVNPYLLKQIKQLANRVAVILKLFAEIQKFRG